MNLPMPITTPRDEGRRLNVLGLELRIIFSRADTNGTLEMVELTGPPGGGIPPHIHTREDEAFLITAGEVEFTLGDQLHRASSGDSIFGPRGVAHGFQIVGSQPLRMYFWVMPATLEPMFDDLAAVGASSPPDPQEVAKICGRFGITFVS